MSVSRKGIGKPYPLVQAGLLVLFVAIGFCVRSVLVGMQNPPPEIDFVEPVLRVEVLRVQPEDVPVLIRGFGEVRPVTLLPVAAAVAGEIIEIHPRLEVGEVIPAGEVLFRVDPRDYEINVADAEANVSRAESRVAALRLQFDMDSKRLATARRTHDLAEEEFGRFKALYGDGLESELILNRTETALNKAEDEYRRLDQAVSLYPHQIKEAVGVLAGAQAQLSKATTDVERTVKHAPFDARVVDVQLEQGQYVSPSVHVLTLASDDLFEISVPLDSSDARQWLRYRGDNPGQDPKWFGALEPVACRVAWTEDPANHAWEGRLDRIEQFDARSRTVIVAVQVRGERARADEGRFPLAEGMFCSVGIPGKTMQQVYRIPRWAVSFSGLVFVAEEDAAHKGTYRLAKRDVEVVRTESEEAYISSGLKAGDLVIVTRLVNPTRGALLEITEVDRAVDEQPAVGAPAQPAENAPS